MVQTDQTAWCSTTSPLQVCVCSYLPFTGICMHLTRLYRYLYAIISPLQVSVCSYLPCRGMCMQDMIVNMMFMAQALHNAGALPVTLSHQAKLPCSVPIATLSVQSCVAVHVTIFCQSRPPSPPPPPPASLSTESLLGAKTQLVYPGPPISHAYWHRLYFTLQQIVPCTIVHMMMYRTKHTCCCRGCTDVQVCKPGCQGRAGPL